MATRSALAARIRWIKSITPERREPRTRPEKKAEAHLKSIPVRPRVIRTIIPRMQPEKSSRIAHITTTRTEVKMNEKSIWIGLVQVLSLPDSEVLKEVSGAYVTILTWASRPSEFREKAQELMDHLGLQLVRVEDEEPLSERAKKNELGPEIEQVASEVRENPQSIRYMTFHTWTEVNA